LSAVNVAVRLEKVRMRLYFRHFGQLSDQLYFSGNSRGKITQSVSLDIYNISHQLRHSQRLISPKAARLLGASALRPFAESELVPTIQSQPSTPLFQNQGMEYRGLMKTAIHSKAPQNLLLRQ
jgi:hypothetical protein